MVKSTEEYIERCRKRYYETITANSLAYQEYRERLEAYEDSFFRMLKQKPSEPVSLEPDYSDIEFTKRGEIFAIQYKDIVGPIVKNYTKISYDCDRRKQKYPIELDSGRVLGDIGELWTIVECQGEGIYKDLTTGRIFTLPIKEEEVLDTVSQDTEERAREIKRELIESPLRLRVTEITIIPAGLTEEKPIIDGNFPILEEATPEKIDYFMTKTRPKEDEIRAKLDELEELAREKTEEYYARINAEELDIQYEDAMWHSKQMQEEERKRELARQREEERRRKEAEELARQQEKARREAASLAEFESLYGETDNKTRAAATAEREAALAETKDPGEIHTAKQAEGLETTLQTLREIQAELSEPAQLGENDSHQKNN